MKKKQLKLVICILWILFSVLFLFHNYDMRLNSPFVNNYLFESVSKVAMGENKERYIIDNGKKAVVVLDESNKMVRYIEGGSEAKDFFYAGEICGDSQGNIYIADTISGQQGNKIQKERIIKISKNKSEILYEFDYTDYEAPPLQYGDILEIKGYKGNIYFLKKGQGNIQIYCISEGDKETKVEQIADFACDYYISDASYDVQTNMVFITTRLGEVCQYSLETCKWEKIPEYAQEQKPWGITAANGEVYYTDLQYNGIIHFSSAQPEKIKQVVETEYVLYSLSLSEDGKSVQVTDNVQFMSVDTEGFSVELYEQSVIGNKEKIWSFWIVLGLNIILITVVSVYALVKGIKIISQKEGISRIIIVVVSSVLVAAIASYSTNTFLMEKNDNLFTDNMQIFAESMMQQIDGEQLKTLTKVSDYHSDTYMQIKTPLDNMINSAYKNNIYYYYVIYDTDGKNINCIMDYEDTTVCGHPVYEYGDNEYSKILQTGESYFVKEISSYGSWMFTLLPIRDDAGNIIAELEVGANLDNIVKEKQELIKENVLTLLCSCSVLIMLILEGIFALSFYEKRKNIPKEKRDITQQMPIRIMVFLVYMTDSMQDAFMALLCSRLYQDNLPISRELAIALPMSIQLFMAAIFSVIGGKLAGKFGTRRIMQAGLISQMLGFAICMLVPEYMFILIGKIFIGIGLGTVYVTSNTMASLGGSDEYVEAGFADVSAGVLSGVTIGVGLGSVILSFADYRIVYLIGALFMAGALLLTVSAKNITFEEKKKTKNEALAIVKFLGSKRIVSFFALMLVPFMISLSYREYFFPLYAEPYGIDEVQIGRIYLVCGVLVLYVGPTLSKRILKAFGPGKSIILASLCMAFNMALFFVFPNIYTVTVGMFVLSAVISFAYTCQYTYFEKLDECSEVGMGNAMGIYSMFENFGQTLGPVVYGAALILGQRNGIGLLFVIMLIMTVLFSKTGMKKGIESD